MGQNNLQLVQVISVVFLFIFILTSCGSTSSNYSFRPAIKVDGEIYLEAWDPYIGDVSKLKYIGKIKKTLEESDERNVKMTDENFTSYNLSLGDKIYRLNRDNLVVETQNYSDLLLYTRDKSEDIIPLDDVVCVDIESGGTVKSITSESIIDMLTSILRSRDPVLIHFSEETKHAKYILRFHYKDGKENVLYTFESGIISNNDNSFKLNNHAESWIETIKIALET